MKPFAEFGGVHDPPGFCVRQPGCDGLKEPLPLLDSIVFSWRKQHAGRPFCVMTIATVSVAGRDPLDLLESVEYHVNLAGLGGEPPR